MKGALYLKSQKTYSLVIFTTPTAKLRLIRFFAPFFKNQVTWYDLIYIYANYDYKKIVQFAFSYRAQQGEFQKHFYFNHRCTSKKKTVPLHIYIIYQRI